MTNTNNKAPLEDIMVAMDVVDTLRHQQTVAERELDIQGRRERMLERLKDMYKGQGIDVPEHVLLEGISALEEERFSYKSVESSWKTKLAHLWVSRARWGKPIGFLAVIGALLWGVYFVVEIQPERQLRNDLPVQITQSFSRIKQAAKNDAVLQNATQLADSGRRALEQQDYEQAESDLLLLQDMSERLEQAYTVRVVSRPNESSGVWRVPPGDSKARNYYLIVEAVDRNNRVLELPIVNEENNKVSRVKTWGLRVSEKTFYQIASDKQDDGIIQGNKVGVKQVGYLQPDFSVPTTGATIAKW